MRRLRRDDDAQVPFGRLSQHVIVLLAANSMLRYVAGFTLPAPAMSGQTTVDEEWNERVQRRGVLIGVSAALGLCLLGCVLVVVAGIPAFRGEVRDGVHDAVATEVARQIPPASGGVAQPGAYTLTAADLEAGMRQNLDDEDDDEALIVRITTVHVEVGITSQGQDAIYTGTPVAEDGALVMRDMQTDNDLVGYLLRPDTIAGAIEDAINDYLAANNLRLDALQLTDGEMTLVVVAA